MPALEVWYTHAQASAVQARLRSELDKSPRRNLKRAMAKARTKDNLGAMNRFAGMSGGQPQIVADPPLIVPIRDLVDDQTERDDIEQGLCDVIVAYRASLEPERRVLLDRYRLIDFARKVVGVGSVGTRSRMALLIAVSDIFLGWVRVVSPRIRSRRTIGEHHPRAAEPLELRGRGRAWRRASTWASDQVASVTTMNLVCPP